MAGLVPCQYCSNLFYAILREHRGCFDHLLQSGADNEWQNAFGETALFQATKSKDAMYYVQKLVEKGANVNYKTKGNNTALHCAAFYGKAEVLQFLVSNGTKFDVVNSFGSTPLSRAIESKSERCIEIMRSLTSGLEIKEPEFD